MKTVFKTGIAVFWVVPYYYEAKATFFLEIYNRKGETETDKRDDLAEVCEA